MLLQKTYNINEFYKNPKFYIRLHLLSYKSAQNKRNVIADFPWFLNNKYMSK